MVVKVQNKDQSTGKNMKKTTKEYSIKQKSNSRNESENDERDWIS